MLKNISIVLKAGTITLFCIFSAGFLDALTAILLPLAHFLKNLLLGIVTAKEKIRNYYRSFLDKTTQDILKKKETPHAP